VVTRARAERDERPGTTYSAPDTYVYLYIASKNITITEDAYEALRSLKRRDESFSDVIRRLTGMEGADPATAAGMFSDEEWARSFDAEHERFGAALNREEP
jgi:predicted CopG family antitoxin